jgi:hypothetical protein
MYVHVSLNVHHCDNRDFICADDQHTNDRPDDNDECYTIADGCDHTVVARFDQPARRVRRIA